MEIRLQTLGPPRCYANGALTDLSTQKLRFALLLYLGFERSAARESVAAMFWPERDEERARRSLAQMIYELRRSLGDDCLSPQTDPLEVTENVVIDALEFQAHVKAGELESALALYQGDFLDGFHLKDSNPFENWLDSKRRGLKQLYSRAAREHVSHLLAADGTGAALAVTQRWIALEPLDDEANHFHILALAQSGKRAEAIAHFDIYRRRIKDELNVTPLPKSIEVVDALKRGAPAPLVALRDEPPRPAPLPLKPLEVQKDYGLLAELKRRGVLRFGWMYLVVVYVVLQGGMMLVDLFTLPKWPVAVLAVIAVLAFPLAIVLSWQFDLTPEGVRAASASLSIHERIARANWRVVGAAFTATASVAIIAAVIGPGKDGPVDDVSCASALGSLCGEPSKMVADLFVVLPITHAEGVESLLLNGETCARFLTQGLSHWDNVRVVEQPRLSNALNQLSDKDRRHLSLTNGMHIAHFLGAGKLVMGFLWEVEDTMHVEAQLYDARTQQLITTKSTRFQSGNAVTAQMQFNLLAQELVVAATGLKVQVAEVVSTRSWPAAVLYDSAQSAFNNWDLQAATAYLQKALKHDRNYPHANLWISYAMMWNGDSAAHWRPYAQRAATANATLGVNERFLAKAINELAVENYQAACDQYRELLARDSASFYAWFGLGECLRLDNTVVRDPKSPSGWSFVTSRTEAIEAHKRALELVPSFAQVFATVGSTALGRIVFSAPGRFRAGVNDSIRFGAWPDLVADTLSLVPYPFDEWRKSRPPPGETTVIARHQAVIAQIATKWAESYPDDPRALLGLARVLEQQDVIQPRRSAKYSALGLVGRAKKFAKDKTTAVRAATTEVRLLIKTSQFSEARRRAAGAVNKFDNATGKDALHVAGLAGLLGRPHQMAELLLAAVDSIDYDAPPAGNVDFQVPAPYARVVLPLLAYASVGAPTDSFRSVLAGAHEALRLFVPIEQRSAVHAATLDRAERMLFTAIGPNDAHSTQIVSVPGTASWHYLPQLQGLLARGDTVAVKSALLEIEDFRKDKAAVDYSADLLLNRVELHLAVGDTSGAIRILDPYLNELHHLRIDQFTQQWQPVANVRLMILRAELAARSGQRVVAKKWANAAYELWRSSDRELKGQVQRLKYLKSM